MPTEYDYMKEGRELGWELEKPKKTSLAEITYQEMLAKLVESDFLPIKLGSEDNTPGLNVVYQDIQKFARNGDKGSTIVRVALSKPHSAIRASANFPRHSIDVKYHSNEPANDEYANSLGLPLLIYGAFTAKGKPVDKEAEIIQKRLFS